MLVPVCSADPPDASGQVVPGVASSPLVSLLRAPVRRARVVAATSRLVAIVVEAAAPQVVCVTAGAGGALPCALTVDGSVPYAEVGTVVAVGSGRVQLPGAVVTTIRWRPVRPPVLTDPGSCFARAAGCPTPDLPPALVEYTDELAMVLAGGAVSPTALAAPVQALLGFGPGLTPAGDDVLTAALVALHAAGDAATSSLAAAIAAGRPFERTTALSAGLLHLAQTGLAVRQLTRFVEALGTPGADLTASGQALLRVGHTSGAAMYLGAVAALRRRRPV